MISACKATVADGSLTSGIAANAFLKNIPFHQRVKKKQTKNTKARITVSLRLLSTRFCFAPSGLLSEANHEMY